ncbi:MAG: PilT/PilU family type 4a pilus ATPase [Blastocatellia bacterium]|nr:PilT/PilU family type 4a pilus ATPase [Blastocatellia bacterium]MBL8195141.1 PilT/PilU family type 4a pilus ATPase [Blastocatellia bacterium]MBN8723214.1 PilT/PilU family type 4a pilus ATPase [Acidobacteriota bacterium]
MSSSQTSSNAANEAFNQVLRAMISVSDKVSDLIFSPGRPPQVELLGQLRAVKLQGLEMLTPGHTKSICDLMTANNTVAREKLEKSGAADLSYSVPGFSRFRVNIFMQRGTHAIVMRVIPNRVPTFVDLGLPNQLKSICDLKNGIVLVTGPTGSGKSSTLAAIINMINERHFYHIVTIEDPIEFIHQHRSSTIHQRELYADCPDFKSALRSALRQAPKVILVGEMRDMETVEIALEAAETGHLVLSTLHTIDAARTIERIIGVFPKSEEHIVRIRLSQTFRYIISQRLIPRADLQGRMAAIEILKSTQRTRDYVEKGEQSGKTLVDAMRDGAIDGMQTFDQVLEDLVRSGTITVQDGINYSSNPGNFQLAISDYVDQLATQEAMAPPSTSTSGSFKELPDGFER